MKKTAKELSAGILLWIVMFVLGTIIMMLLGKVMIGVVLLVLGPIAAAITTVTFFKDLSFNEGIRTGLTWAAIAIILDTLILVFLFKNGWSYFLSWTVWSGYIEIILVPSLVSKHIKKDSQL